ncbi:hypothetical protein RhiirA5_443373 [Rhizophagus irregularis]|uniref:Uncharacterized protein n=2 Tax=Rhizophagus irregularis TaxID=588596 RepID=A0A2N0NDZ3_9GLOM|nr:hypothetical protein RhiirA5_443373 [Rhizophagus irregularis]GBC45552.1 hypothetical protein RIR_e26156_A0A2N0NDZ3_9GLOM [Rhizophagus irregularis DAOM 181602=DAOM 197198]
MPSTCRVLGRQLNIGKSTVTKTLEDLSSLRGRPRILTNNDIKYLESLLKEKSRLYLWEFII